MQLGAGSKKSRIACALLLTFLAAVGALAVHFFFVLNPRDRVEVSIVNVPAGTYFLCVVTDSDGAIKTMDWSVKLLVCYQLHPNSSRSYGHWDDPNVRLHQHVMWMWGDRYGVVSRKTDKTWWVTWFRSVDVPFKDRGWARGGGTVEFDLSEGKTEPLPSEQIRQLALQDVLEPDDERVKGDNQ
jgi:hypothetical protein